MVKLSRAEPQEKQPGTKDILTQAACEVEDRLQSYGPPDENHKRTAEMWSTYLGVEVSPRAVCMLNALQKISRDCHAAKRDNLVDIAGYARNAELVSKE